jgi:hypothetical protein
MSAITKAASAAAEKIQSAAMGGITGSDLLRGDTAAALSALKGDIVDTLKKQRIYRTRTEMLCSVLQDYAHPTNASKYWQANLEMERMFKALIDDYIEYRRNHLIIKTKRFELDKLRGDLSDEIIAATEKALKIEELEIDIEAAQVREFSIKLVAEDRAREIQEWSAIKSDLVQAAIDAGQPFNTDDIDAEQLDTLFHQISNRVACLTEASTQPEKLNAVGMLHTINRMRAHVD